MSQPASRSDLKEYALRRLGKPVLEINVDDDQIDDLIDDALQMFNERHYNGSERMFLKHKFTASDVGKFKGLDEEELLGTATGGIITVQIIEEGTSGYSTATVAAAYTGGTGVGATFDLTAVDGKLTDVGINIAGSGFKVDDEITFTGGSGDAKIKITGVQEQTKWEVRDRYLDLPADVVGVTKVFGLASNAIRNNLFGIEYQIFLNDLYAVGSLDFLNYYMVKTWMETMDMVLNNGAFVQFRFNMRQDRLYIDVGKDMLDEDVPVSYTHLTLPTT